MAEVNVLDWNNLPRMLREMCDGPHGGYSEEIFRLTRPDYPGNDLWLCRSCYVAAWVKAGCPPQQGERP